MIPANHIELFINRPVLLDPRMAPAIEAALRRGAPAGQQPAAAGEPVLVRSPDSGRLYPLHDGVAVIAIEGVLINRLGVIGPCYGLTGYDGLRVQLAAALADREVEAIVFAIDSPGGMAAGCRGLAEAIYAARGTKLMVATLAEEAYSAAYWLASAADYVTVPRTGGTGSIGAFQMHLDFGRALDSAGITPTLIFAGAHKVDGHPFGPLPEEVYQRIKADVEDMRDLFIEAVARNRKVPADAVRATEALTLPAPAAFAAGLVDAIVEPEQAFAALVQSLRDRSAPERTRAGAHRQALK